MKLIVLPQAFRNMLPVLLTQTIILFQDTSLVYVIGAYDLLEGLRGRGQELQPAGRDATCSPPSSTSSSASACRCWCAGCRRRSPSSARTTARWQAMIDIKNVSKWYGSFQVLTDCTTERSRRARSSSSAAPRARGKSTLIKMRQRARAVPEGRHRRRRHLGRRPEDQPAEAALARRHGVPALRAVPAPDRSPRT